MRARVCRYEQSIRVLEFGKEKSQRRNRLQKQPKNNHESNFDSKNSATTTSTNSSSSSSSSSCLQAATCIRTTPTVVPKGQRQAEALDETEKEEEEIEIEEEESSGFGHSPYPLVDKFISSQVVRGGVQGSIRRWTHFPQGG